MILMPEDEKNPFPSYKDEIMSYDQIVSKNEKESGNITLCANGYVTSSHVRKHCYTEPV